MPAKRTHDVVATVGKYKDQSGEEKKRFINVGSAFTSDEGNLSIKLDAVPVSPEWSGWLSLYPVKERSQGQAQKPASRPPQSQEDADSDIPF